ncbi:hypothetical protein AAMO2058_000680400 [Amorphochlora amoebiformis]
MKENKTVGNIQALRMGPGSPQPERADVGRHLDMRRGERSHSCTLLWGLLDTEKHFSGLHSKLRGRLLASSDSRFSITMELHMCCYLYFTCAAIRVKRANFGLINRPDPSVISQAAWFPRNHCKRSKYN